MRRHRVKKLCLTLDSQDCPTPRKWLHQNKVPQSRSIPKMQIHSQNAATLCIWDFFASFLWDKRPASSPDEEGGWKSLKSKRKEEEESAFALHGCTRELLRLESLIQDTKPLKSSPRAGALEKQWLFFFFLINIFLNGPVTRQLPPTCNGSDEGRAPVQVRG